MVSVQRKLAQQLQQQEVSQPEHVVYVFLLNYVGLQFIFSDNEM